MKHTLVRNDAKMALEALNSFDFVECRQRLTNLIFHLDQIEDWEKQSLNKKAIGDKHE